VGRERGREGGEFFACFLFLFLGRRASAFGELGRRQGEHMVRWETRPVGQVRGTGTHHENVGVPAACRLLGTGRLPGLGCRARKERT
jgi:hypothetical protein